MGLNITKDGPNKWLLDIRVRKGGKEFRRRETFFGTKTGAEERFVELKREIKDGSSVQFLRRPEAFKDLLDLYKERRMALTGLDETRFNSLLADLGNVPLQIFPERFYEYLALMRKLPSRKTGKIRSNGTVNRFLTMAKTCFNLAVDLDLIEKNPLTKARFPMLKEVPRDKVLSPLEAQRLIGILEREAPHLAPMVRFALQVPCRRAELANMKRGDLDLIHNAIRVRNGTTKNDQGCWKPVPPDLVGYFRSIPSQCPYLFYRVRKGQFQPLGDFKKSWKRCLRLAGIEDFRFHDTRHISATNLLDNGTPEQVVIAVAGWKTNMLKTYYHRSGKKSLELVRFTPTSGHPVDTSDVRAAQNC